MLATVSKLLLVLFRAQQCVEFGFRADRMLVMNLQQLKPLTGFQASQSDMDESAGLCSRLIRNMLMFYQMLSNYWTNIILNYCSRE